VSVDLGEHMKNHEIWVADLFGELIQSGLQSDEHLFWKDRNYYGEPDCEGNSNIIYSPSVHDISKIDFEKMMSHLAPIIGAALTKIIEDYSKK
jgi:hypothetical protein